MINAAGEDSKEREVVKEDSDDDIGDEVGDNDVIQLATSKPKKSSFILPPGSEIIGKAKKALSRSATMNKENKKKNRTVNSKPSNGFELKMLKPKTLRPPVYNFDELVVSFKQFR